MPTYDYKCEACGHAFEKFQSITAKPIRKCPKCGRQKVKRLIGTGAGMIFDDATKWVLAPFGKIEQRKPPEVGNATGPAPVALMLTEAKARFPDAELRRLTIPSKPGQAYSVRMRQPFEWTPNGRTTLFFDGRGKLLRADDPATGSKASSINEKLYL